MSSNNRCLGRSRRPYCRHEMSSCEQWRRVHSLDAIVDSNDRNCVNEATNVSILEDSLQTRFGRLLSSEDMSDVHFLCGQLRIPAHRVVLGAASDVFRRMLFIEEDSRKKKDVHEEDGEHEPSSSSSADGGGGDVELSDVEPVVLLEVLRYVYCDEIRLHKENVICVLSAAKRYCIASLERKCIAYFRHTLDATNCVTLWLSSRVSSEPYFERIALKVIERFARAVCAGSEWPRVDHNSLRELLRNDLLRVDECDLFVATMRWAKSECVRRGLCPTRAHVREVLGSDCIQLIRFPLMSDEQLRRTVATEGVLEDDVLRALLSTSRTWPRSARALQFPSTPRAFQRLRGQLLTVQRFQSYDNQLPNRFTNKSLVFTSSHRIFVSGIGVYGPRKATTFYMQVWFRISRSNSADWPTLLERAETSLLVKCDGSQPVVNVKLDDAFEVDANTEYEICAKITPTNRMTVSGMKSKLNPNLYYTRPQDVHYYYGTVGQMAAKVKTNKSHDIIFNFSWNQVFDDTISENSLLPVPASASLSAPPTPNPPPRPPPPKEYRGRAQSRMARLKRALSFTDKSPTIEKSGSDGTEVLFGQIPVILFFA